jgi:hypothetical protein
MKNRTLILIAIVIGISAMLLIIATLIFTPESTNPAFDAAVAFVTAATAGDDAAALALVSQPIRDYAAACPDGRISACVRAYTPPEWGDMVRAVFRRAIPDGAAWDIDLISFYRADTGASGVCIYTRAEPTGEGGAWQITAYAGFIHCADAASRSMANNPAAPNRVPPLPGDAGVSWVTITEERVSGDLFGVRYPRGWRVITSPAGSHLVITLVAPGDCAVVLVGADPALSLPPLPDCPDAPITVEGRVSMPDGKMVYLLGSAPAADRAVFQQAFDGIQQSVTPAGA